ncbi:hypothetical protein BH23CHL5_BH23CHL5_05690 [soil metagenome]
MPDGNLTTSTPSDSLREIDHLRARLAFYESFDSVITENISRSGDLLREAASMRESAALESEAAHYRLSGELQAVRESFRSTIATLLDDVTDLQGQAERIARRLTDVLDDLESQLMPGPDFPALPADFPALNDVPGHAMPGTTDSKSKVETAIEPEMSASQAEVDGRPVEAAAIFDAVSSMESDGPATTDAESPVSTGEADRLVSSVKDPDDPFELLVHGVPRAATALALKRYLEALDIVDTVEPREFAAGVLRLQIRTGRSLTLADLETWASGLSMTQIRANSGLLELQLTG